MDVKMADLRVHRDDGSECNIVQADVHAQDAHRSGLVRVKTNKKRGPIPRCPGRRMPRQSFFILSLLPLRRQILCENFKRRIL